MIDSSVKIKVLKLRQNGLSLGEINKLTSVSKSTISVWGKEVKLTRAQRQKLISQQLQGLDKATKKSSKIRKEAAKTKNIKLLKESRAVIGNLTKRERFIAGIFLYMADGTKKGNCVDFTNSDPKIIKFMVRWFVDNLDVEKNSIKAALWLHKNLDETKAIGYWSKLLNIPKSNFGKTYFAKNITKSKKIRTQIHQYGVIKIRVYNISKLRQIKAWIEAVLR